MPYDIIGNEIDDFVGSDFIGAGYDDVDQILAGMDIVGATPGRYAPPPARYGRAPAPGAAHYAAAASANRAASAAIQQRAALQAALQQKRAGAGLLVNQQQPTASRRLMLPMQSTAAITAGSTATITSRPQNLAFKPQRLVVPATIAPDFYILDIKVGNVSQFVQSGAAPAEAFTQQLFDGMMEMDTVNTSQDFVVQVQNIAGASRTFTAAVYGLAVLAR